MKIVFGREEKTGLILLLAVVIVSGVIFLLLDITGKESFASPYDPSADAGDLVLYDGQVNEIIYTNTGGHLIVISDNISIFIRNGAGQYPDSMTGMQIHAVGTIEIYNGEREIYVSDPADAEFLNITSLN